MIPRAVWAGMRREYELEGVSVDELSAQYGIAARAIRERINRQNWTVVVAQPTDEVDGANPLEPCPPQRPEVEVVSPDDEAEDLTTVTRKIVTAEKRICDKLGALFNDCVDRGDLESLPLFKPAYDALKTRILCERVIYGIRESTSVVPAIEVRWAQEERES